MRETFVPMQREGRPEEIANTVLFLLQRPRKLHHRSINFGRWRLRDALEGKLHMGQFIFNEVVEAAESVNGTQWVQSGVSPLPERI